MRALRPFALLAALAGLLASPAYAAERGPLGVAFVQAEEGTWWCHGADRRDAIDCAAKRCAGESGGQDCVVTRWCYPAGWSVLMVAWLPEFHTTYVSCGLPGPDAARAAARAVCEAGTEFSRCDLTLMLDPDGAEQRVDDASWPGAPRSPPLPGRATDLM